MRLLKNAFIFLLVFIGRTDAEADTPMLWLPDVKNWLIWMDPDAGKDWRWEKGMTEDEMVGLHHWRTWVWASSRSWWWTGKPGMLQSMGSQRVEYDWETELNFFLYINCIVHLIWGLFPLLMWVTLRQKSSETKHSQFSLWEIYWLLNWLLLEFVFGWSLHDLWNSGIWLALSLDSMALSLIPSGTLSSQSRIFWTFLSILTLWKSR